MQEFVFLFRNSADEIGKLSDSAKTGYLEKWTSWFRKLTEDGVYENVGDRLISTGAKTIKGSDKIITDGPFPESKEIIAGFIKIKAENLDEAAEIAKGCPIFFVNGSLEIRTSYYM